MEDSTGGTSQRVYDAVIVASPAWAAGVLLGAGGRGAGRRTGRDSLLVVDHRQPGLRRGQTGTAAGGIRLPGSGKRRPRHAGLHLCASQVPGAHAAGQGGAARLSGRHEKRGSADRDGRGAGGHRPPGAERDSGREAIGLEAEPEHAQVSRWRRAMAQYAVGHQERMERITARVAACPDCAWPATPTTASAFPTAFGWGARRRRSWWQVSKSANK